VIDWITKKTFVFLLIINLSACSVIGELWYERIDTFIANQFLEYADFSSAQEDHIRKAAKEFKQWNLENELPKYKALLIRLQSLDAQTGVADIEVIYQAGLQLNDGTINFFRPFLIEFCKDLTNKQVTEIGIHLNEMLTKRRARLAKGNNTYQEDLKKSFVRIFRLLRVKLNDEQKDTIRLLSSELVDTRSESIVIREVWNREFAMILALRNQGDFEQRLTSHLNTFGSEEADTRAVINEISANIIASLDEKQRTNFQKRLGVFETSIDQILAKNLSL
jgi:hypothetical protein